jgi:hypothetical protein
MHALERYTGGGKRREPQIGSFFGIDIAIGAIITAVAGAISSAAGVVGLASIISAPIATALATTFVTGLVATLSGLIAQIPSEIGKAFGGSLDELRKKAEDEIRKAKPDWPDGRVEANAQGFVQSVGDLTLYLSGQIDRPLPWDIKLPKRLLPGTIARMNAWENEVITRMLLRDPVGMGGSATLILAKYADPRGGDSETSDRINRNAKTGKYAEIKLSLDDPTAPPPPPKVLTPEENFAAVAKGITDAGGKLVGETDWNFDNIVMPTLGPDVSTWEIVDWSIAPFLTRDQRLQLATSAVDAYPTFGHGLMGITAKNPFLGNYVAAYAAVLVDPSAPFSADTRWMVTTETSQAGAAINTALRSVVADRARASAATKGAAAALAIVAKPPAVTVNAKGAVVVVKPKPTLASFVWGAIYGSR